MEGCPLSNNGPTVRPMQALLNGLSRDQEKAEEEEIS